MDDDSILEQSIAGFHLTEEEKRSVRDDVRKLCIEIETSVRAKMRLELTEAQFAIASGLLAKIDKLRLQAEALERLCQ